MSETSQIALGVIIAIALLVGAVWFVTWAAPNCPEGSKPWLTQRDGWTCVMGAY